MSIKVFRKKYSRNTWEIVFSLVLLRLGSAAGESW